MHFIDEKNQGTQRLSRLGMPKKTDSLKTNKKPKEFSSYLFRIEISDVKILYKQNQCKFQNTYIDNSINLLHNILKEENFSDKMKTCKRAMNSKESSLF